MNKTPLNEHIFETIRDRIVRLTYAPGFMLPEKEICQEFKVSRTPVKEALKKLEEMGLVTIIPRYGTTVSGIDISEIRCAFEIKIQLEKLAGSLAAKRITENRFKDLEAIVNRIKELRQADYQDVIELDAAFHEIIYDAAQNPLLKNMLQNLHSRCARLWCSALRQNFPGSLIAEQLQEILDCLKKRDDQKTSELMEQHVQSFIDLIKEQLL